MLFLILLPIIAFFESLYYFFIIKDYTKTNDEIVSAGVTRYFHLYFMIITSFYWRNEQLADAFCIYFILDFIFQKLNQSLSSFTIFHHSLGLLTCYFYYIGYFCPEILNISSLFEVSTIIMCLYDLGYLSEKLYKKFFAFTFILFRLLISNSLLIYTIYNGHCEITILSGIILTTFTLLNLAITYSLNLIPNLLA